MRQRPEWAPSLRLGRAYLLAAGLCVACSGTTDNPDARSGPASDGGVRRTDSGVTSPGDARGPDDSGSTIPGDGGGNAVTAGNPFAGARQYINPDYVAQVQSAAAMVPAERDQLARVATFPTAIWLDSIAKAATVGRYLDDALAQQTRDGTPVVTVFVVYDLPNRDCAAHASNGELQVDAGGVARYRTEYIDPIAAEFRRHPNQRIVALIEPDSLPNLATNLSVPRCAASDAAYRDSVAYAIRTLAAPHVYQYLDAAHSGWLGWPNNQTLAAQIFRQVLDAAGGVNLIRGFATNVANYTPLREGRELFDYQSNPCRDELTYVQQLGAAFAAAGITNHQFLIDTSRNGRSGIRHQWGYWCNNRGAGLGERPRVDPGPGVDAYVWIKPPGESDGTSDRTAARFDVFCGYEDATPNAPEAGQWFQSYFVDLVHNAEPPL